MSSGATSLPSPRVAGLLASYGGRGVMLVAIAARRRARPRRIRTLAATAVLGTAALASWSLIGAAPARCRGADDRVAIVWAAGVLTVMSLNRGRPVAAVAPTAR